MNSIKNRKKITILLILGLLIAFQLILWAFFYTTFSHRIYFDDSLEQAQTARSLLQGKGFSMLSYPLQGLDILKQHHLLSGNWPNLQKFPLPPFMMVWIFYFLGSSDSAITFSSAIFYFLLIPVFFLFARRVVKVSLLTAIISSLILLVNPVIFDSSLVAQPEPAAALFFLIFIFFLTLKNSRNKYFYIGITAAVAYFNRAESLLWILLAIPFICLTERRFVFKKITKFFLSFVAISVPWWSYVAKQVNNPFFTLQGALGIPAVTKTYPNYLYSQMNYVDPIAFIKSHPAEIIQKWLYLSMNFFISFPRASGLFFLLPFLFFWFFQPNKRHEKMIKLYLVLSFTVIAFFSFFYYPEIRYFAFIFPFIILFSTKMYIDFIRGFSASVLIYLALIAIFLLINTVGIGRLFKEYARNQGYKYEKSDLMYIKLVFPENSILLSNLPRIVGWYSERRAVTLPGKLSDVSEIEKKYASIDGIYITSSSLNPLLPVWEKEWGAVKKKRPTYIGKFRLIKVFQSGSLLYKKYL